MPRNLSINDYFIRRGETHHSKFRFNGKTKADWERWRNQLLPEVIRTMGTMPRKVPLNPELIAEWREDGLIKQRIIFDVEENLSALAYVFRPENTKPGQKLPAILACHGHGPYGKEAVMGNRSTADLRDTIARTNEDYGLQLAKAGFVTIAIDWRGFGERDDRRKPRYQDITHGRDQCNLHFLLAILLGETVLGQNLHDGMCALDYLCQQDFVDPDRIGVVGQSFGGTMATWISLFDPRIKATNIICYSDRFSEFGMTDVNLCGSQITPNIYALCDVPDLHGLTAPRPLLTEIGIHDDCFLIKGAMSCFKELEKIYTAAGVPEKLELDLHGNGHRWAANKSFPFFKKYLT